MSEIESHDKFQALLAAIVNSSDDAIISKTLDSIVTSWNPAAERLFGWTAAEAIGQSILRIIPPDRVWEEEQILRSIRRGERVDHMEVVRLTKDGRHVNVSITVSPVHDRSGRVIGASKIARDITARKRADAALQESRDVLALAMRAGRMGAWSRNLLANTAWWSPELEEIFGLPRGAFEGSEAAALARIHPDDRAGVQEAVRTAVETGHDYTTEFRFQHSSGEWRWMEGRGRCIYDAEGRAAMLHGLGIDVTERRRVEEALRESDRRKNEFLAVLAHELRNPLAPIRNSAQFMRLKAPADRELQNVWEIIDRQAGHLSRLVDDLLDVSRISTGKINLQRERVTLSMLVTNALETVRPLIDLQRHRLTLDLPAKPIYLDADPVRMTQVLQNLLNNAAKYTPPGGQITLTAREGEGEVRVSVRDNGVGIPAEMLPRVFEMFTQVDRALERRTGGLGIGLTLVQRMVEMHGGHVEARSAGVGRGSEFVFSLPAPQPRAAGVAAHSETAAPPAAARRVLVVDDNTDAAQTLAMMLKLLGHQVEVAGDGLAAVEAAERFDPDVVLLDIGLPGLNGYDAARRIRALPRGSRQLLVALTGWGQEEDRRRSQEAGFDQHLVKPVDAARLSEVLHTAPAGRTH